MSTRFGLRLRQRRREVGAGLRDDAVLVGWHAADADCAVNLPSIREIAVESSSVSRGVRACTRVTSNTTFDGLATLQIMNFKASCRASKRQLG